MGEFEGVLCPTITPFDAQAQVDLQAYRHHLANLLRGGVHGIVPLGTMGEFSLLGTDERRKVAEATVEEVGGRAKVIVGTGSNILEEARALTRHAADIGADGALVVTPYYFRPNVEGLRRFYSSLHASADLPLLAYNIPPFTGYSIDDALVVELAEQGVLAGLKDSQGDLAKDLHLLGTLPKGFSLLTGADPLLTALVLQGGQGGVLGTSNVFPSRIVAAYEAAHGGDLAKAVRIQEGITQLSRAIQTGPFPAAIKYMVARVTGVVSALRLPVTDLSPQERSEVDKILSPFIGHWL